MTDHLDALPAAPKDFQRFAWNGLPLLLPEAWNLQVYSGSPRVGALLFVDMQHVRLELRWRRAGWRRGHADQMLNHAITRLQKHFSATVNQRPEFFEVRHGSAITILLAHDRQLLELHWPSEPEHVKLIAEDFTSGLRAANGCPDRIWSVYGATGHVPKNLKLRVASMLPGATRLEFRTGSRRVTLGSFSLADRLLGSDSLQTWAGRTIPLLKKHEDAAWTSADSTARAILHTRDILPWRKIAHTVQLRHDLPANRIEWTHRAEPV